MSEQLNEVIGEFDAGIFSDKIVSALKLVALGVVENGKKGSININIELNQIGDSSSVNIKHTLKYVKPTRNGKASEENTTQTPMYVDKHGVLTISPQLQQDLFNADKSNTVAQLRK